MERRKKWLKILQLENYKPVKSAAVCSVHFKDTDYELNHTNRKLKREAVPYVCISTHYNNILVFKYNKKYYDKTNKFLF